MTFQPQVVIKVGGSLSQTGALPEICQEISRLAAKQRLLIIPGGGEFADLVRKYYRRYALSETAAHRMAILAMDQYGILLGELTPNSILLRDILSTSKPLPGIVPILLPSKWLFQADPLPHSWAVTSDSIAAWVAGELKAQRLILLKDVDGLFSRGEGAGELEELVTQMSVEQLRAQPGGVDTNLASVLASLDLETWVINGRLPRRLAELLDNQHTLGTHISRAVEQGAAKLSQ
jgi:aspartokinase-like uncharacterized kinase